jgi:hypothetical protein
VRQVLDDDESAVYVLFGPIVQQYFVFGGNEEERE